MIRIYDPDSDFLRMAVDGIRAQHIRSSVQITVARHESGVYTAELGRLTAMPASLCGMEVGELPDVPPGQRRATWLLTDAVSMILSDPDAHGLLHW